MASLSLEVRRKGFPALGAAPARAVLRGVAIEVELGETLALLGPSGCGKTTLLNLVAGLDREFEGRIGLPQGARLAYVFQEPRLLPWRTVRDNIEIALGPVAGARERAEAGLAEVGLADAAEVFAGRLSLGMARRAALARAFAVEPTVLLLDEPFVSLDAPTARRSRILLLDLLARHAVTALFVTHDLDEALTVADRVVVLGGAPATVVLDLRVGLPRAGRRDRDLVEATRRELLKTHPRLEVDGADRPETRP